MKALIFGVGGQDGAYLAKLLLAKGYEVHGTSRDAEVASFEGLQALSIAGKVHKHSVNLNEFRSVVQVLRDIEPNEIYNLAGQSSVGLSFAQPIETFKSIVDATLNVLEAIRFLDLRPKFYNAASSEVFGDTGGTAANEATPMRPRSPYGVSKASTFWLIESYRQAYGLFACSGILFNHESPLRKERFVTQKIIRAAVEISHGAQRKLSLGDISVSRDWGWAPDYVDAMWMMLQRDRPDDFVIATGLTATLEDFVRIAFDRLGLDWRQYVEADPALLRPYEIEHSAGDACKAARDLGWRATVTMPALVGLLIDAELRRTGHAGNQYGQTNRGGVL